MPRVGALSAVITGAAGFLGCHLADRLTSDGWRVTGIDDERTGDWTQVSERVTRVSHDLTTLTDFEMRTLLEGTDVLFHLAAEKQSQPRPDPDRILEVNVIAMSRLLRAAGDAAVGKVVFTSSLYAYGSVGPAAMVETDVPAPRTVYGVSKLAGEHLLRAAERERGLRWTAARVFFIYGPRQHARGGYRSVIHANFERIRMSEPPTIYGDGRQALDYTYVDDCIDALVRMASHKHDGLTVNIASGQGVTVTDLTTTMLDVAGSNLEPVGGPADWTAGTHRTGSTLMANEELGWQATTTLAEGLRRVWASLE